MRRRVVGSVFADTEEALTALATEVPSVLSAALSLLLLLASTARSRRGKSSGGTILALVRLRKQCECVAATVGVDDEAHKEGLSRNKVYDALKDSKALRSSSWPTL
jgi:hypothetical protein